MRTITFEQFRDELNAKYQKPEKWRFKCPDCGNTQSVDEFIENGHNPNDANLNCLNCYLVLTPRSTVHTLEIIISNKDGKGYKQPSFEIA